MQFNATALKGAVITAYHRLLGGRIARTTFALRVAVLVAVVVIISLPLTTVLSPSSKTLKDVYLTFSLVLIGLCLVGLCSAYVRRLHDIGLRGYWAPVFLIALPTGILSGGGWYQEYRFNLDHSYNTAELNDLIGYAALIAPFLLAMWRGQPSENRFGPVPSPVEHVATSKFNMAAVIGAAAILIPTTIYAGIFQPGVWVGRGDVAPQMPIIDSNSAGVRFMKCWNIKGVGAGSGAGPVSGVFRDGYDGIVFDFILRPDGRIDIVTAGKTVEKSYVEDGFRVVPYGLKVPEPGSAYMSVRGVDRFMLAAIYDQGGSDSVINYTTFAFGRNKGGWPEYHLVMTTALSSSGNATGLAPFPEARGKLMIGDCIAG